NDQHVRSQFPLMGPPCLQVCFSKAWTLARYHRYIDSTHTHIHTHTHTRTHPLLLSISTQTRAFLPTSQGAVGQGLHLSHMPLTHLPPTPSPQPHNPGALASPLQ